MFVTKEELSVQVGKIDSVEVDDVNFAKACEYKVLE
jgi:hypothetical protein